MKPVPPHHLLSAYLDGELSSAEREEVERLLAESPQARQELEELKHVGELLRQLPRQSLPGTFSSQVLDECLSDTGQFSTETLAEMPSVPSSASVKLGSKSSAAARRWRGFVGLGFTLAAGALVFALVLPDPAKDRSEVATNSPHAANDVDQNFSTSDQYADRGQDEGQELAMAPANEGSLEQRNEAHIPQVAENQFLRPTNEPTKPQELLGDAVASQPVPEALPRTLPAQTAETLGEGGESPGEEVRVVKVFVDDRQKGLDNLQALLQQQQILREEADTAKPGESAANRKDLKDVTTLAVYVETTQNQLENALKALESEPAFQQVKPEAPIAVAQLDSYLHPAVRSRMLSGFGAGGAALPEPATPAIQGFRAARTPQAEVADKVEKGVSAKSAETKQAESKPEKAPSKAPQPDAAPEKKAAPAARRMSVAGGSPALNKLRDGLPQANRPSADADDKETDQKSASRQKPLTLPKALLEQLQKATPEAETIAEKSKDRSNTPRGRSGKRVQVLFILVDQPQPASPANSGR